MATTTRPLITAAGVLILLDAILDLDAIDDPGLDRIGPDGRRERERLGAMQADLARLRAGDLPSAADLRTAPLLQDWCLVVRPGDPLPSLTGILVGAHPHATPGGRIVTSCVVALDAREGDWARTVSRYYRLGRPVGMSAC